MSKSNFARRTKWKYTWFLLLEEEKPTSKRHLVAKHHHTPTSVCTAVGCNEVILGRETALVVSSVIQ